MKILITGASGLIGSQLQRSFAGKGYEMLLASRGSPAKPGQILWDPTKGFESPEQLERIDAVVHLAGESISALRWSDEKKRAIRDSRVHGTRTLVDALAQLRAKPKVFVSASATGFYGDRGDEIMTETTPAGDTFLAATTAEWEAEASRAQDLGIRTVLIRTGVVLSKDGGALGTMLTPFKFGVGGVVGSGNQWMSWISMEDIVEIYNLAIENENLQGPINAVAPNPVTNKEFTKALGDVIHRPTILPLPAFAVNLVFGEMGDALLLDSTRVLPKRLLDQKFEFLFTRGRPALENALR